MILKDRVAEPTEVNTVSKVMVSDENSNWAEESEMMVSSLQPYCNNKPESITKNI